MLRTLSTSVVVLLATLTAAGQSQVQAPGRSAPGGPSSQPLPVRVFPAAADVGSGRIGEVATPFTLTLTNTSAQATKVTGASFAGDAADFTVLSAFPIALAPGASQPLDVALTAQELGPRSATLLLHGSNSIGAAKVPLVGVGYGPTGAEVFVNAGGDDYVGADSWEEDYGFSGGTTQLLAINVSGTNDLVLHLSRREAASFGYAFELPNGPYEVFLHFSDWQTAPGERVFDVLAEGVVAVDDLDIVAAVGTKVAKVELLPVTVSDGQLNLDFVASSGDAIVNAIEIRSIGVLDVTPATLDMGIIDVGNSSSFDLTIANTGLHTLDLDTLQFTNVVGDSKDLSLDIQGTIYSGDVTDVSHTIDLTLAGGDAVIVPVSFVPSEHATHEVQLTFSGVEHQSVVDVDAISGFAGDPYLHPVLLISDLVVDYDSSGTESVLLDGSDSHTHEPGKNLIAWEWSDGTNVLSTQEVATVDLPLGGHTITLTIFDDNVPSNSLADSKTMDVVPVNAVPGTIIGAYNEALGGQTAMDLLDAPPTNPDFAELLTGYELPADTTVGSSTLTHDVLVRFLGRVDVQTSESWAFTVVGGTDYRVLFDGNLVVGSVVPTVGLHDLEVRVAVEDAANELPIQLTVSKGGGPAAPLAPGELLHDEQAIPPVLNTLPSSGTTLGGNQIILTGLGFFPLAQTTVHWGGVDLTEVDFTSWAADRIEFFSPPGAEGAISVSVETPGGVSNVGQFTYQSDGPVPIQFQQAAQVSISQPTAAAWGPDGRLYVINRLGRLNAITFDDTYGVVDVDSNVGVSLLSNHEAMGLAFDPFDAASPVRVYVSHSEMYAQGGGSFSGPAPYLGQISVLEGPDFDTPIPVLTNLPVSNHDHGVNGLLFDANGDLLFAIGGNTNAGIKWPASGDLPETPLSGAIVKAHLSRSGFDGALSYVETLTGLPNNDQVYGEQVDLVPGVHVDVHAPGVRNCFDMALATNGYLYATDNGPNNGFGLASTSATTQSFTHPVFPDELLLVEYGQYYGHPNRSRGRYDDRENVFQDSSKSQNWSFTQALTTMQSSVNGLCEYRATAFGGQLLGDLLAQKYNGQIFRIELAPDGRSVDNVSSLPGFAGGLGLATGPGGALVLTDYGGDEVRILTPVDQAVSGMTPYEVTPWRAPGSGGAEFVIGGENFGTLGNTTVTFDSLPAALTSVSPTRIRGIVPANSNNATTLVDVSVTSNGSTQTLTNAFRWLPDTPGQNPGQWSTAPDMPIPAGEVACGVIQSRIYLVGEGNNKTYSFHVPTSTWYTGWAVRPFVGHHNGSEVWNNDWYLIGGLGAGGGKVQIYDPQSDSWSLGADMPWAGGSVSTALIGDSIYAAGGIVGSQTVDQAARYDLQTDTWQPIAPMPTQQGRNHAAAGTDGQRFFVFGGRGFGSGNGNVVANGFDDIHVYDPVTDTWESSLDVGSTLAPLPIGRGGTGKAVWFQKEFYVFGGETLTGPGAESGNVYDRVDVYDPMTNTWRVEPDMPTARHGIFPVVYQGKIYVAGGGVVAGFSSSSVVEVFSKQ